MTLGNYYTNYYDEALTLYNDELGLIQIEEYSGRDIFNNNSGDQAVCHTSGEILYRPSGVDPYPVLM